MKIQRQQGVSAFCPFSEIFPCLHILSWTTGKDSHSKVSTIQALLSRSNPVSAKRD